MKLLLLYVEFSAYMLSGLTKSLIYFSDAYEDVFKSFTHILFYIETYIIILQTHWAKVGANHSNAL